jgi:glycerol-3-phosphate acyltransferase PlsY
MDLLAPVLMVLAGYLVGSLSFAVIVSRVMGLADPRSYGSGNPGATNVLRSGSRAAAITTLALDALKGYVPVLLALIGAEHHHWWGMGTVALCGLAAFLGHVWPVFFKFKGGKGVATAAGVLMAYEPVLGLCTLGTWIIMAAFFRYSSLASLTAAVFAPFYYMLFWDFDPAVAIAVVVMSLLLVWRHSANIVKLFAGTELKIGQKVAPAPANPVRPHPRPPSHTHPKGKHR